MTTRITRFVLPVLTGVVLTAALYAQSPRQATTGASGGAASGKKKQSIEVKAEGGELEYQSTAQGDIYTATDRLKIVAPDMTLTTDKGVWNDTTKIATSPGKMQIQDPENTLTGNTGTAYYKTKDAKIRGNVVINARPKANSSPPEGSPRREFNAPATITCESVDYNWRSKVAVATGNLKMVQKDRTVTADKGVFESKADRVTLEGNVVYVKTDGQRGKAKKVIIIITEGKEQFKAYGVKDVIVNVEDEEEITTPGTGTPPIETGPGGASGDPGTGPGTNPPTPPATPPGTTPPTVPPVKPDPAKPEKPGEGGGNS
jgi:lipopolysaccharide assembly outer membrane protein LptD (OstA)